jgi:hypothetical protein
MNASEADDWLVNKTGKNFREHIASSPLDRTFFIAPILRSMTALPGVPEFVFASRGKGWERTERSEPIHATRCTARTIYVDAKVTCQSRGGQGKATCGVYALRVNPNRNAASTTTVLTLLESMRGNGEPDRQQNKNQLDKITKWIDTRTMWTDFGSILEGGTAGSQKSSNTEHYLHDPTTAFINLNGRNTSDFLQLSDLDIATFERRFSLMWNTLWKTTWAMRNVIGFGNMTNSLETVSIITIPQPDVYVIDRAWLTVYFIAVLIMFLAGCFSLIIHAQCRAPAILGFASSLIRDSRFFESQGMQGNSVEDGPQKTRRLGRVRIMVADVKGNKQETGKIAFVPAGLGGRIEKRRWFE